MTIYGEAECQDRCTATCRLLVLFGVKNKTEELTQLTALMI